MTSPALHSLAALLPPERLLVRPEQLAAYESDALTAFRQRPLAVAIPETSEEVIALVQGCHAAKLPFVARGSGYAVGLTGGDALIALQDGTSSQVVRLDIVGKNANTTAAGGRLNQIGDLSRANIMKQAASLKDFTLAAALPGIKINTSPTDFAPIESVQLARFDGKTWVRFGEVMGK